MICHVMTGYARLGQVRSRKVR